jgi:twitching motility protein PilT
MSEHKVLAHVDEYLKIGMEYDCSDIHLPTAYPPTWRRFGTLAPIWDDHAPLTAEDTERLAMSFLGDKEKARLEERGDVDFAYANEFGRFRASVVRQRLGLELVFGSFPPPSAPSKNADCLPTTSSPSPAIRTVSSS